MQDTLLFALRAAGISRTPVATGRTDAGVHARMQVLSMRRVEGLSPEAVAPLINRHLPPGVGIALSRLAPPKFNAAWHSATKEYRYRISLRPQERWARASWTADVDPARLAQLLALVVGRRDFFAFHNPKSPRRERTISRAMVSEREGLVTARLTGDGFGRYMVRQLVGGAVAVARGEASEASFRAALDHAAPFPRCKAPPEGLVLWEVFYPPEDDPFSAEERRLTPGLPGEPPFCDH